MATIKLIGDAPNQVSRNKDLGTMAFQDLENVVVDEITIKSGIQGDVELSTGNLVIGTSGKGIDFSATSDAAGMTSELLDDYEEGTWTPEITFFTPGDLAVAYSSQVGIYTKVGRIVTLIGCITTSSFTHTTASGNFLISGMPFTSANVAGLLTNGSVTAQGWTKAGYAWLSPQIQNNATSIYFQTQNSGSSIANVTVADIPTATTQVWRFAVTYFV